MQRFKAEAKRAVMHRDQSLRTQLEKRFHGFLRIHMNFAASRGFVGANGKQCDLDLVPVSDFLEPRKVSAVAAVKNRTTVRSDEEPAEIAMRVREETGAPVVTRGESYFERSKFDRLPIIQLVHNVKSEIVHQVPNTHRHNDRLVRSNSPQGAPIEMIEVCVRH